MHINRLFEWLVSAMMVLIAITVAVSPKTIAFGGFAGIEAVGLTAPMVAVLFSLAGCLRCASLYANGHWPVYGPRCRAACALAGALIWVQMLYALTKWSLTSGYLSIGIPVYACLTIGEIISCYRAASDGRAA